MTNRLPDFFVVGAQKAGTTTLHEWLEQSSEIAMPWSKETHFFRDVEKFSKGPDWYLKQFKSLKPQTKVVGEIDPEYMYFPECAERIKTLNPKPKLIFVLRDPVSRAHSHYKMSLRRGYETLSFEEALVAEKDRLSEGGRFSQIHHSYIGRGLYSEQIARMLSTFKDAEVMVIPFEHLFSSQEIAMRTLREICDFIGISHSGLTVDVMVKENQAAEARFAFVRDFIYGKGKLKRMIGRIIPSKEMKIRIMRFLDRANLRPAVSTGKNDNAGEVKIPAFVYETFIDDLRRLEKSVKIDVSCWIAKYEEELAKR